MTEENFLSRWSRRKNQAKAPDRGEPPAAAMAGSQDVKGDSSDAETDALRVVISECLHTEAGERAFPKPSDVSAHPWRSFQAAADAARRVCLLLPDEEVKKALGESEGDPTYG